MEFFSPFFRIYTCNFHQTRKYLAIWLRSRPEAFPLHWPELIRHGSANSLGLSINIFISPFKLLLMFNSRKPDWINMIQWESEIIMKSPFIKQAPISFDKRIKPMNIPLPIIKKIKKKTAKELDIPSNPSHSLLRWHYKTTYIYPAYRMALSEKSHSVPAVATFFTSYVRLK